MDAAPGAGAGPGGPGEISKLAEHVTTALQAATTTLGDDSKTLGDDSKTKPTAINRDFITKTETTINKLRDMEAQFTSCPTLNIDPIEVSKLPHISAELQELLHEFYNILINTLETWTISVANTDITPLLIDLKNYLKYFNKNLSNFSLGGQELCTGIIQVYIVNFILIFSKLYFKKIIDGLRISPSSNVVETVQPELEEFQVQLVKTFCRLLPNFKLKKLQFILNRRQGIRQIMDEIYTKKGVKRLIGLNPSYVAVGRTPDGAPIVPGECSDIIFTGGGKAKKKTRKQKKKKQKLKSGKKNKNKSKRRKGSRKK
jgi:hypothetical protein